MAAYALLLLYKPGKRRSPTTPTDFIRFTDCTATQSPDGQTGREWCYVEVQLQGTGPRDWDFCRPVIDYDYVRQIATESIKAKLLDAERVRLSDLFLWCDCSWYLGWERKKRD